MKNLFLTTAAIVLAAVSYAQTPVTDSSGGGSGATAATASEVANLSGSPATANRGISIQNGNDQKVFVQQVGTRQSASIDQGDGTGSGSNEAQVLQYGLVQPGVSGERNRAEVTQDGTDNESNTRQFGDRNNAVTSQGQNDDASSDNRASIRQGSPTAQQAQQNAAYVEQDGESNRAITTQTFDSNSAWTKQDGDRNESRVTQNGGPNQTFGHRALNTQAGDDNRTTINQSGAGAENDAEAHQLGNGNQSWQVQTTDAAAPASMGNNALINQGVDARRSASALNATIGADLVANVASESGQGPSGDGSTDGIAYQLQSGTRNTAESHQFGDDSSASNYSEQRQSDDNNDAFIVQNAFGNASGGDNYGYQNQSGDNNSAGLSQRGRGHKAAQRQMGDNNIALSGQKGNGNNLNTNQFGDMNVVYTEQSGVMNQALVNQNNGQSWTVNQNLGDGGTPNGNNSAQIYQAGPTGVGMDPECMFDDQVTMPGPVNIDALGLEEACPDC